MRIRLEKIVFDGLGPFRHEETFDLPTEGVTYVYAPNGHGKTSTIDLVRWLIRGQAALENDEFRSLKQDAEKDIINHHRFRNMEGGRAEAIIAVEGEGRFRVQRTLEWGTSPSSELTVERDEDGSWEPIDEPDEFLSSLLPHERLGFNLLTGEHVRDFVEDLSGPVVKRSVERMLQNPELVSLQNVLADIEADMEKKARAEDRTERRRAKLKDKRADLKEREENFRERVREKESEEHEVQQEIEQLNQKLATVDDAEDLTGERKQAQATVENLRQRREREVVAFAERATPSWRTLLASAARDPIEALLDEHAEAIRAHEAWEQDRAEARVLEERLEGEVCVCGTELDDGHRKHLRARIEELAGEEPEAPTLPADASTLHAWAEDGSVDELVEALEAPGRRLAEVGEDLDEASDRLATIEERIEAADGDTVERIERQLKACKMKLNSIQDDKSKHVRNHLDAQERLNEVKDKLASTESEYVHEPLLRNAREYNAAVREAIDEALPKLRDDLLDRTQAIFDQLFQKDAQFRIALSGDSMVPHVVRDVDGEEETVPLSDGEQTRLGLALLFALREVAIERPFLLLDAPFSTLDDRGVQRLLELIADHDGQLVVFTKDAFPQGRFFEAVEAADPTVYRMDWVTDGPGDREGLTEVKPAPVDVLQLEHG